MPLNVKLFLGTLGIIACASAYGLYRSFGDASFMQGAASLGMTSPLPGPSQDADHDGLSNEEESYWNTDFQNPDTDGDGFKDGEEVASGHDPNIKGPDDILPTSNIPQSVTKKTGSLILSGLYEGSLTPKNGAYEDYAASVADSIIDQAEINTYVTVGAFPVLRDTPESLRQYAKSMSSFFKQLGPSLNPGSESNDAKAQRIFKERSQALLAQANTLESMSVPVSWTVSHTTLIRYLKLLSKHYEFFSNPEGDPLQTMLSFNNASLIVEVQLPALINEYHKNLFPGRL